MRVGGKGTYFFAGSLFALIVLMGCQERSSEKSKAPLTAEEKRIQNKIDSVATLLSDEFEMNPAIGIAVVRKGKIIIQRAYGKADLQKNKLATDSTCFYIASATKPVVGLLASALDQKGVFSLNTSLKEAFSEVDFADSLKADKVRMYHLLSHTSAVNCGPLTFKLAYTGQYQNTNDLLRLVQESIPNGHELGDYVYDNTGYNLYALALEKNTGMSWKEALTKYILEPLQMEMTFTSLEDLKLKGGEIALAHLPYIEGNDEVLVSPLQKTTKTLHSAGGIFMTVSDMAKFLSAVLNEDSALNRSIFLKNKKAFTDSLAYSEGFDANRYYSLGWNIYKNDSDTVSLFYHFGHFKGSDTKFFIYPQDSLAIAVTTNSEWGDYVTSVLKNYSQLLLKNDEQRANESLQKGIKFCRDSYPRVVKMYKSDIENRINRVWKLRAGVDFSGKYSHPTYGDILVNSGSDDSMVFNWGEINCVGEPYADSNTVRVEFIPAKGEVVNFKLNEKSKVEALIYRERTYLKQGL